MRRRALASASAHCDSTSAALAQGIGSVAEQTFARTYVWPARLVLGYEATCRVEVESSVPRLFPRSREIDTCSRLGTRERYF